MSEGAFHPQKRKPTSEHLESIQPAPQPDFATRLEQIQVENNEPVATRTTPTNPGVQFQREPGLKIGENVPPQVAAMLRGGDVNQSHAPKRASEYRPEMPFSDNGEYRAIIEKLSSHHFEEVHLPSQGKFYDGTDGPSSGVLHVRPMTGKEEEILATPRFVKRGKAMDMIFESCVREKIKAEKLLSVDRTFLLIYLRGISYTPYYEVEIKCPECNSRFAHTINLDENIVSTKLCPDDFSTDNLSDVLPTSGLKFSFRISRGLDEVEVASYHENRVKQFGSEGKDDTLAHRTALLLNEIEGITDKNQIKGIIKMLPVNDVNYIRNVMQDVPFGVNDKVDVLCPSCFHEFVVDLPMNESFFFPRRKKKDNPA